MTSPDNFLKAWAVSLELIEDRGYIIDDNYKKLELDDIQYLLKENKLNVIGVNKNGDNIYLEFVDGSKIKLSILVDKINKIKEVNHNTTIIFIIRAKKSASMKKIETKENYNIQIFESKYLQINPTKHTLVPIHLKQTEKEIEVLHQKYNIMFNSQLPVLLQNDPIARYYNFKKGNVIKITNKHDYNYEKIFHVNGKRLSSKELILEKIMLKEENSNGKKSNIERRNLLKNFYKKKYVNNILRYRYVK